MHKPLYSTITPWKLTERYLDQMISAGEKEKGDIEIAILREYISRSGRMIEIESIQKREGNSIPDIECTDGSGLILSFEIVRLLNPRIERYISNPERAAASLILLEPFTPYEKIIRQKLAKRYNVVHPVELICHVGDGEVPTPDEMLVDILIQECAIAANSPFFRVWFTGAKIRLARISGPPLDPDSAGSS